MSKDFFGHNSSLYGELPRPSVTGIFKKFKLKQYHIMQHFPEKNQKMPPLEEAMAEQTFASFLYNRKNSAAVRALEEFSRGTGPDSLIISGSPGCGKTHLLHAAHTALQTNLADNTSIFRGCFEDWKALDHPGFLRYTLVDNITASQAVEILHLAKRCLVAIRSGQNLSELYANQPGRVKFTHLHLAEPDLDIRIRYIRREIALKKISIRNEDILNAAIQYNNLILLEKYLHTWSTRNTAVPQRKFKLALRPITHMFPEKIIQHVAEFFQLNSEDIKGKKRGKTLNLARHTAMFLCRDILGSDLKSTGSWFQGKNHASVLYSINKISMLCKNNKNMHKMIADMKKKLSQGSWH